MTLHNLMIDKRTVQRNIEQGKLEPAEYQRILDSLPDLSDKVWRRPASSEAVVSEAPSAEAAAPSQPIARAAEAVSSEPASAPRQEATAAFDASL